MKMCFWVLLAASLAVPATPAFTRQVDAALDALVREGEPGIAVCAADATGVIYRGARGLANVERRVPMTTSTPVYIASVAKAFTTVAVLQLVEQGKLTLDNGIVDRVPGLPAYLRPVTVRHLLTHTSGLPALEVSLDERPGVTNADILAFLAAQTSLVHPAGARWRYSNAGFVLLAELVAQVDGRRIDRYFEETFFTPLRMTSTFVYTPATRGRERASGYRQDQGRWVLDDYRAYTVGPGGVFSSADDMCAWGVALDGGKLLKRMTMIGAFTPHVNHAAGPTPMGLGFQVEDIPNGALAGSWYAAMFGIRNGFRAVDMKIKDRPFRYVQVSNSSRQLEPVSVPNMYFQ